MIALFSPLEIATILVVTVLSLAAMAGAVYRLARRAARDGARDAANEASSPPR